MVRTIDMQDMRHLNLFSKVTKVNTRFCFKYNGILIFSVPKFMISKAIGEGGRNIQKIQEILGKRVKVVALPKNLGDIKQFIEKIVAPYSFKNLEVKDNEIILTAGSQSKAALIGREKRRLLEMQKIIKGFFGKEFKIV